MKGQIERVEFLASALRGFFTAAFVSICQSDTYPSTLIQITNPSESRPACFHKFSVTVWANWENYIINKYIATHLTALYPAPCPPSTDAPHAC